MIVNLNRYIDHTLLKPYVMDVAFESHLEEAVKHNFYSVCVPPYIAKKAVTALKPYPNTKVTSVVTFPHGNVPLLYKYQEVSYLIENGVHEVDWVLHYGEVLNENWPKVSEELRLVSNLCRPAGVVSKCIIETSIIKKKSWLVDLFKRIDECGVDFIKTSTGFVGDGARIDDIKLWNNLRFGSITPKIKASGGIKSAEQALAFINAGADRLGTSASVEIMEQYVKVQTAAGGEEESCITIR